MKVLVACEFSGTVRDAFTRRGHDAWSCDLLPSETPGQHIQGDVLLPLSWSWDLLIAHPPCTFLTSSAEWAYKDPNFVRYPGAGYHQKLKPETLFGEARREAAAFFLTLWRSSAPRICIENPVGHISQHLPGVKAQKIQPYDFGSDASKGTCLWLRGLPPLRPTRRVAGRMVEWPKGSGKIVERWANQTDSGQNNLAESEDRWAIRSVTYPGTAAAMAEQWAMPLAHSQFIQGEFAA